MIETRKVYQVMDFDELLDKNIMFLSGIWCTDNFECRNMSMEDAKRNSKCIGGCFIDESIKNCLIFTFFDPINYSVDKDTFIEISYDDLLENFCKETIMICCAENDLEKYITGI